MQRTRTHNRTFEELSRASYSERHSDQRRRSVCAQFIWQLDPCAPVPFPGAPPPPPDLPNPNCPSECEQGDGALPPPPAFAPRPAARFVPGTDYGPNRTLAPTNGTNFERWLRTHDTVRRIVLGRPQEQIKPWRWAVTFRTTNWNMSLTEDEGPQLIMNNVTGALLARQRASA